VLHHINKLIVLLFISVISLFGFEYKLEPKKVSENVWCFFGKLEMPTKANGGNMSNNCYVKTKDSYVLIDSGATFKFAKTAYEEMSKIEELSVSLVINTHEHDDHWLGNSFYKDTFNAKIIGVGLQNKNYKEGDKTRMHHLLAPETLKGTRIVTVDEVVKNVMTITVGDEEFTLIPVGTTAHSPDDIFVYMPKRKVLFSGDIVMNGRITSNRDGSVIGQLKALDMVNNKKWNTLVPGHGYDTSKTATNEFVKYFTLLKKRVLEAVENDVGAGSVTTVVKLEEFKGKPLYDELNSKNIFDAYRELEFYEEE